MILTHPLRITWLMHLPFACLVFLFSFSKDADATPLAVPAPPITTSFASAAAVIDSMGTGFNLGNTFDYALQSTTPTSIYPIIDLYANAGMNHIRIPVTWMDGFGGNTLADASGHINISHPRFIQLKAVIDYAINKKLFVVLNAHHEHWLNRNYNGTAQYNTPFTTLWTGIATHFKDYSHLLIFEVLNEPHGVFGDWSGGASPSNSAALALTRQINQVGYDAIRATGGLNANRVVMVSTNGMGNHNQLDDVYPSVASLPGGGSDKYLAFHVHTYDPWAFCGQTGSNASWPGSSFIANSITTVSNYAKTLNVPVNYGEFGVGRDANASERNSDIVREYYRTMRLTILGEKMSPTVWDDRGWFGLVNSGGIGFLHNIVPTMMAPVTVSVEDDEPTPSAIILRGNYPNPFNPVTSIVFELTAPQSVTLEVFNAMGQRVATLADSQWLSAGTHERTYSGLTTPSGIYFVRISSESGSATSKMMLIK